MAAAAVEAQLTASVHESLSLLLHDNARFLCERLVAANRSESNLQLLAQCYILCDQAYRAYHLLKDLTAPRSRYLFALAALKLGKYGDARDTLSRGGDREVPYGAAGLYLLGRAQRFLGRFSEARRYFAEALRRNPLLWSAFEELCSLGSDDEANEYLEVAKQAVVQQQQQQQLQLQQLAAAAAMPGPAGGAPIGSVSGASHITPLSVANAAPELRTSMQQYPAGPGATTGVSGGLFGGGSTGGLSGTPPLSAACSAGGLQFGTPIPMFGGFGSAGGASLFPGMASSQQQQQQPQLQGAQQPYNPMHYQQQPYQQPQGTMQQQPQQPGHAFLTPAAAPAVEAPPAPPHKNAAQAAAIGQAAAQGDVPFPGFNSLAGPSGAAAGGGVGGSSNLFTPATVATPGSQHEAAAAGTTGAPAGGARGRGGIRGGEDGKARKVSNKLFHDPGSSLRRSQRLAALNSTSAHLPQAPTKSSQSQPAAFQPTAPPAASGASAGQSGQGQQRKANQQQQQQAQQGQQQGQQQPPGQQPQPAGLFTFGASTAGPATGLTGLAAGPGSGAGPTFSAAGVPGAAGGPVFTGYLWYHEGGRGYGSVETTSAGAGPVLALLVPLVEGCRHLAAYRCAEALESLNRLALPQRHTAYVYCLMARAHFERVEYAKAAQMFEAARRVDRHRLEGLELYSTVLWHMRRHYELAHLAQEAAALDRLAPQTWCILGNLFSAQKDHEAAKELFLRAIQVDPSFAYAYTLAGHEHSAAEDWTKAVACYRAAVKLDPRHYNAHYGLGVVSYRQERVQEALAHFKAAAAINPRSSVLATYLGLAQAKLGDTTRALASLKTAIELDPANPLARYERASVLMTQDQLPEALAELEGLARYVPGEPSVGMALARIHKQMGNLTAAQQALEMALSAQQSAADAAAIRSALERLGVAEEEEESEM